MKPTRKPGVYEEGMLVEHPAKPEWGPGKVLAVDRTKVTVYFRDFREENAGDAVKKIDTNYVEFNIPPGQTDPLLDNLLPFTDGKFTYAKRRLTFDEGIEHFHRSHPRYFEDPAYIGDLSTGERTYKWNAHELFTATLGDGKGEELLANGRIDELSRRALAVDGKVNLLSPYEKMALRDALQDEAAAQRYFAALFAVLAGDGAEERSFTAYIDAVQSLPAAEGRARVATWPVLTLLPFLAQPGRHMLLKPGKTNDCAARLRLDIQYRPGLNWITYKKLLQMSNLMMDRLRQYGARDYIDIQSFMWLIGEVKT